MRRLRHEGLAIIYISHRMAEVYELADRVSVLRDGRYVGTLEQSEIEPDALVRMMVGRDLSSFYKKAHVFAHAEAQPILEVSYLSDSHRVKDCSFVLSVGEVLGFAGLIGAGRTEMARMIYGAEHRTSGSVRLAGREVAFTHPAQAIAEGIAYLTEDRKAQGLFLDLTVNENINLGVFGRDSMLGWLNFRRAWRRTMAAIEAMAIRVAGPQIEVGTLSGGNQQKVLLSRLLETAPKVLILDEPTRGVDIGAKAEIYRIIAELARGGIAVLVISSELPEIVGISDRVVVMREGETVGEVGGATGVAITEENILALATGVQLAAA